MLNRRALVEIREICPAIRLALALLKAAACFAGRAPRRGSLKDLIMKLSLVSSTLVLASFVAACAAPSVETESDETVGSTAAAVSIGDLAPEAVSFNPLTVKLPASRLVPALQEAVNAETSSIERSTYTERISVSDPYLELQEGELAVKVKVRAGRRACTTVLGRRQCTPWASAEAQVKLSFALGVENFRVVAKRTHTDLSSGNDLIDVIIRAFAAEIYTIVNTNIDHALARINGRDLREELNAVSPIPVPPNARFDARVHPDGLYLIVSDGAVRLEASNIPGQFVRHQSYVGVLTPVGSALDQADSAFRKVPGLAGSCSSFESTNYPGSFLRHSAFRIRLDARDGSRIFDEDATFCERGALNGAPGGSSFESFNFPGRYIRHRNFEVWVDPAEGSPLFQSDATFFIRPE